MNDEYYGRIKGWARCATCGTLIVVYAGSVVGGAFAEHHVCRDIKADADCREQRDSAPNHGHYPPINSNSISVTTSGTSTAYFPPPPFR